MKTRFPLLAGILLLISVSCDKDNPKPEPEPEPAPVSTTNNVTVEVSNMVNGEDLVFNKKYLNAKSDTFTVTRFIYYVSNVSLVREDGAVFSQPDSYHLIDQATASTKSFNIAGVPPGNYKKITFLLGVDSAKTVSGVQNGDLDQSKGMWWTWNSGYIFMKMEGKYISTSGLKPYTYHIGGYRGANKTQRYFEIDLGSERIKAATNVTPKITLKANVAEIFMNPKTIDLTTENYAMTEGPFAKVIADNYADMITFKSIQN